MKKKTFLQGLLAAIIGNAFLFSCSSEEMNEGYYDVEKDNSTSMIANSKEQNIVFDIKYEVPEGNKVIFDVYANNPFEITSEGFTKKKDLKPIISAMTDEDGAYNIERVISDGVKEVYVVSNTMGVPALLHGVIERGVVKPMELDLSSLVELYWMFLIWVAGIFGGVLIMLIKQSLVILVRENYRLFQRLCQNGLV